MKNKYLDFYKINFGAGRYCTKSWGLASYKAGAASRQGEVENSYKIGYQDGFNSRQAEIDELKWMLKNANGQADDFCKKSIELQKRIDELNQDQQVTIDDLRRAKAECIKFTNRVDELHDNIKL